jgi:hypothetical protein
MIIAAVTAVFVVGFLIGLFTFRVKSRWCPECGATTMPAEPRHGQTSTVDGDAANCTRRVQTADPPRSCDG